MVSERDNIVKASIILCGALTKEFKIRYPQVKDCHVYVDDVWDINVYVYFDKYVGFMFFWENINTDLSFINMQDYMMEYYNAVVHFIEKVAPFIKGLEYNVDKLKWFIRFDKEMAVNNFIGFIAPFGVMKLKYSLCGFIKSGSIGEKKIYNSYVFRENTDSNVTIIIDKAVTDKKKLFKEAL